MNIYIENITGDYQEFFEQDYNVIIYAGEEPYVKEFHAHSIILRCRSQYFQTALSSNWAEKKNGMYIIKKPNISGNLFQIILRYIYSGTMDLNQIEHTEYLELIEATDELAFDNIRDFTLKAICQKTDWLFENERFLTIPPRIFELLLQQDELTLDEIEIWNYLIKWTHAQNPIEPSKWKMRCRNVSTTKDDIEVMKRTIDTLIPLIRFKNITFMDYSDKIYPYEELLPKKLVSDIWKFYVDKSSELDSFIITQTQKVLYVSLFLNWINKKDIIQKSRKFIQYEFKLILRGSKDGFECKSFHSLCDKKGATIIIAKIKNSNQIVGGYNPLDWRGYGQQKAADSFLFCFDDYSNVSTAKIGRLIDYSLCGIVCDDDLGPVFGYADFNKFDLAMKQDNKWSSTPTYFPNIGIPNIFEIDDYEVFQVVKLS